MKNRQRLAAIVAGISLCLAAGAAQADKVKFYIGYSDYGHNYHSSQRHSYKHIYPQNHGAYYNYQSYYGIKHDKSSKYQHKHHSKCPHAAGYYSGYKYKKYYSDHQQYGYDKHRRHQ